MNTTAFHFPFDTRKAAKELIDSGLNEKQADTIVNLFVETENLKAESVATKGDLNALKAELKAEIFKFILTVAGVQTAIIGLLLAFV